MIVNELSLSMEMDSIETVRDCISQFLNVCKKAREELNDKDFLYTKELFTVPFIDSYGYRDWISDGNVPQKEKSLFRSLVNKGTPLDEIPNVGSELTVRVHDIDRNAVGCLVAYEHESYVVSILSDDIWNTSIINGLYTNIDTNTFDKLVSISNWSKLEHIDDLVQEQRYSVKINISSGEELWEKRSYLFPNLVFCDSVEKQLENVSLGLQIRSIIKRLQILDDYFATYEGNFDKDKVGHGCRDESTSVGNNEKYKQLRMFTTPNGEVKFFNWHISFGDNFPGRVHFLPDPAQKKGIIGYIGKHLPTAKFSTI